jgi:hypothetical protein
MLARVIIFFSLLFLSEDLIAQNPLPQFSVDDLGKGKIRISWVNPYGDACIQVSIQRSFDSVKNFRTILSALSPGLPQNGFIDNDYAAPYSYYRIFYVLDGGAYYFTKPHKVLSGFNSSSIQSDSGQIITVYFHDSVYERFRYPDFKHFSDSILTQTRDSLFTQSSNEVILRSYISHAAWIPSMFVYTDRTGNLNINIPDAKQKNYSIIFFGADDKDIFTIKHLDYTQLVLDKASFMHSGWYSFEIRENGKLKERNKFFLQKDF